MSYRLERLLRCVKTLRHLTYEFKPINVPLITSWTANQVIEAAGRGLREIEVSLDLGISRSKLVIEGFNVLLPDGQSVPLESLRGLRDNVVYMIVEGRLSPVEAFSKGRYYKLRPVGPHTAPTLEISGIHMHRIVGVTPFEDSMMKVKAARVRRGHLTLDVCTGLGYTAIAALRLGASMVVTVEKDEVVLDMARLNPWSRGLADDRVVVLLADAMSVVKLLPDEIFDRVVHDPPRFSLAGELYSATFYSELYRVLREGGILYHYVGSPGHRRGKDVAAGVMRRLKACGFTNVRRVEGGVLAFK